MASSDKKPWWANDALPGYILLAAAIASFMLQNGPLGERFSHLLHETISITFAGAGLSLDVHHFINDGLMAIFFLYVGLELKRECIDGPFANIREAALPLAGALGGMAAPALIFLFFAQGDPEMTRGWAIPSATDIAFALGVLALLGKSVPPGLRLFLLTLAIADDLGAILIIAFFYSTDVSVLALLGAGGVFAAMLGLNRLGVRALTPYWLLSLVLWGLMYSSGVHATIAGVLTALSIPMRRPDGRSPLIVTEHNLKPWVSLGIMPIFALTNAGVSLTGMTTELLVAPLTLGIGLGLLLGKPIGITAMTALTAAAMRRPLPAPLLQLIGLAMVAGIGFTMSLFIGQLAFEANPIYAAEVRIGVLGGSLGSAILGLSVLAFAIRGQKQAVSPDLAEDEETAERQGVL